MEKKCSKKVEKKVGKKTVLKSLGDALGTFLGYGRYQKNYIEVVTTKKNKSQNENPQRWIDSQFNSESFKTDFKLK